MDLLKRPNSSIRQQIIDIVINEKGRPIPAGIILKKIITNRLNHCSKSEIYQIIDQLVDQGTFKRLPKSNSIVLGYIDTPVDESNLLEGTININLNGAGFITLPNENKAKYFVHRMNMNGALNGDKVQFALLQKKPLATLHDAKIMKVLSHAKDFYVGVFHLDEKHGYSVKLDDEKFYLTVKLDSIDGLVDGHKILIKIKTYEKDIAYGSVSHIIGHTNDVGVDILSIVYDNGIEPDFNNDVLEIAKNIKLEINDQERKIRKDLTKLPIVTIDPKTSKDFDDAIYVRKIDDIKYYLSVSIADVSHYVRYKSALDEEALKRGCSIYLVDRVIPMLPHNLSDDICSLNPNVERLTLTCDMEIDNKGKMSNIHVYPSIIKSHRRFSYDEVNEYFKESSNLGNDTIEVKQMLNNSLALHRVLDKAKIRRGYINFNIPEPMIIVDDKGIPTEIKKRESGTAQHMIEDFMVMANEAVTIYAKQKK
jgi:ribonuclease R